MLENKCVNFVKSPGGSLTLVSLIRALSHCLGASTDIYSFAILVELNVHCFNLKNIG